MRKELSRLIELDREIVLIGHIQALLGWDQETYMPPKAVDERSEQIAFLEGIGHEKLISTELGDLLAALGSSSERPAGDPSLAPAEGAFLRVLRRAYDRAAKLPTGLVADLARATTLGQSAWVEARSRSDFKAFAPYLERIVELERAQASCLSGGKGHAYDSLLDLFEPGATEAGIAAVFHDLRRDLVELIGKIRSRPQVDDSFLHRPCLSARQAEISAWLMSIMGYDTGRGRLDTVAHPFTTTLGVDDVRITTRYLEDYFGSSVFSTIHEAGHALYELGIAPGPEFSRTHLHDAVSMGIHESQSRMWENMIGRSAAFWKPNFARLSALAGDALGGVELGAFVRAINKVEPSLIRTEADEVTYGLHIILRFELEADLISERLSVKDIPSAWNAKMGELLGLVPPDDARGCLQDVHWSAGLFGYFPSYALGNLYAAQFWDAMERDIPGLEGRIASGDLASPLGWLRRRIHQSGATFLPGGSCGTLPARISKAGTSSAI